MVLSDNRTKATAKATVVTWNKWVTQEEDGGYTVSNPINRDALEVIMVKEDGIWNLSFAAFFIIEARRKGMLQKKGKNNRFMIHYHPL